jgi:hypothetical protein
MHDEKLTMTSQARAPFIGDPILQVRCVKLPESARRLPKPARLKSESHLRRPSANGLSSNAPGSADERTTHDGSYPSLSESFVTESDRG